MATQMATEEETAPEKTTFTCSCCGFECHYEYFGRKPPFSKSVMYEFCCLNSISDVKGKQS